MGYSVGYAPTPSQLKRQKQKAYHNSIAQTLSGRVSGVNVGATAGASPNIKIRGMASITNASSPLYIVDG
ncbi:TonB-dependent receptor plug domain-containing protein, partial [Winogradskyella poriferorum]|uniref:TonB-dependent receptor plug domain-containing protein n=1 Tax=Winogradskyella poriferorum TaxID=307627 RepID=UPI003D65E436